MNRTSYFVIAWSILAATLLVWFALKYWPAAAIMFSPNATLRSFAVASDSMLPTLRIGDVVRPLRINRLGLSRGMVVVFKDGLTPRIDRVVGLPGDEVSLLAGHVEIDGAPVVYRRVGSGPTVDGQSTTRFVENLPGERYPHEVLDAGKTQLDDVGPFTVPPGRLFVMGDNRDLSADSRLPRTEGGVALVDQTSVIGHIDNLLWDRHGGNVGLLLGNPRL